VLHAVDCNLGFQAGEAVVRLDVLECFLDRRFGGVGWEGFEHGVGRRLPDSGDDGLEGFGAAREEGDGEVAVRGMREDTSDSCALSRCQ